MKKTLVTLLTIALVQFSTAQTVHVGIDEASAGKIKVSPKLPKDGQVKKGKELTISAIDQEGMTLDALYHTYQGFFGTMHAESVNDNFTFTLTEDTQLGASFIENSAIEHLNVTQDIVYAKPGNKPLKYDVYAPKGAENLPVVIIIHGGGWSSNNEDIMRGLARELTRDGKFVVFSMDYRWIGNLDGDNPPTGMHQIIEDVYGGIAHIQEHAAQYGGNPNQLFLTGDSAGGHLSSSTAIMIERIGDGGFSKETGIFEFKPTYIPSGMSTADLKAKLLKSVLGVAPSYGVFRGQTMGRFIGNDSIIGYNVAPINHIPNAKDRSIPNFLTRGSNDPLITDEEVSAYTKALNEAGQRAEYIQITGASHAFFDWKPDQQTKDTFAKYGVYYAKRMEEFFLDVLKNN